jgi:hypothetical protein
MKDPNQVLRQKEVDLARVRKEVESLNTVAALLEEDNYRPPDNGNRSSGSTNKKPSTSASEISSQSESKAAGSENLLSPVADSGSSFLNALKRAM